jgi:hypothetical protein
VEEGGGDGPHGREEEDRDQGAEQLIALVVALVRELDRRRRRWTRTIGR